MNIHVSERMTVDEFLVWSERQPKGRYELFDGQVAMQQSERWGHSKLKWRIHRLLEREIDAAGVPYFAAGDGPILRIDHVSAFEPDALIAPLPAPDDSSLEVMAPCVVVEVLSPSTARIDLSRKLIGYFKLPSVVHYLVLDPEDKAVVWYRRGTDGRAEEPVTLTEGTLRLDPPGIALDLAELFPAA